MARTGHSLHTHVRRRRTKRKWILIVFFILLFSGLSLWFSFYYLSAGEDGFGRTSAADNDTSQEVSKPIKHSDRDPSFDKAEKVSSRINDDAQLEEVPFEPLVEETPLEEDDVFTDAVFIGNSRTQGFSLYSGLADLRVYADKGFSVNVFFTKDIFNGETAPEALREETPFSRVYIMFGINEISYDTTESFADYYGDVVDELKEINPDAIIYIQSILPVSKAKSDEGTFTMEKIHAFNDALYQLAKEKEVYYLNVAESMLDDNGYLVEDASTDGIHLKKSYVDVWVAYLRSHKANVNDYHKELPEG